MPGKNNQYAIESERLRNRAAACRLRVLNAKLALAFTLCALAETEIRYGRHDEAFKLLNNVRRHAEEIRNRVDEPDHLPRIAISDTREQLEKLEKRTAEIESRIDDH